MKKLFTLLLALVATTSLWAHDFEVDGIYYNILSGSEVEVTYRGLAGIDYSNEYSGSVAIPETVTYKGITYSVTSIEYQAFYNCSALTSVTIGNSVTSIGGWAFRDCSGLTSVTIGNSVTSIGNWAFYNTGIYNNESNWENGVLYISNCLIEAKDDISGAYIIKEGTRLIADWAFYECSGLTSMTIPNSVTSIGFRAFSDCSSLTSVTIGNGVTSIVALEELSGTTFEGCSALTSVVWNAENCADFSYTDALFYDIRSQITSFTFGNQVQHIPAHLCCEMSNLTSITIPNSVTTIGERAFQYCSGLTSITIGNSVTSIGESAFWDCSSLTSVTAPAAFFDIQEAYWVDYTKSLTYAEVNAGELTADAFGFINRSYKTLKVLNLAAATNTTIADEAFKGCYNLDSLYLPAQLEYIPYMAVAECKHLQSITIPATVTEIDDSAFENCRSLKSVIFEGGEAPQGAPHRAAAEGSSLWRIGSWAFYNCHQLEHLTIPEGVTEIGDAAFYGCTYLQDMTLPSTVQEIGDNGFALCAKLQKIHVKATTPPAIKAKTFFDVNRQIPVYVPDEVVDAYKDDPYWSEFDIQGERKVPSAVENTHIQSPISNCQKIMRNGQLIIIRDGVEYNAMGVEL